MVRLWENQNQYKLDGAFLCNPCKFEVHCLKNATMMVFFLFPFEQEEVTLPQLKTMSGNIKLVFEGERPSWPRQDRVKEILKRAKYGLRTCRRDRRRRADYVSSRPSRPCETVLGRECGRKFVCDGPRDPQEWRVRRPRQQIQRERGKSSSRGARTVSCFLTIRK